ncbi:MAG: hypothetical protein HZB61_08855 [Nitrospirae bacterium]|nr:hypothetical protein [Nitrospirota bacterium]
MYRDDFYIAQNITGYSGNITSNPTVYFRREHEFGRITQEHDDKTNIGRNKVRIASDYKIYNEGGFAREFYNAKVQHDSRGLFREVKPSDWQSAYLILAIPKFTELKSKYGKQGK